MRVSHIREGEKTFGSSITTTFLLLRICSGVPGDGGIGVGRTFDLISCSCKRCAGQGSEPERVRRYTFSHLHTVTVIVKTDLERILPNDVFSGDWSGACGTDGWREPPTGERMGIGDSIGVPGMIS